MKVVNLQQRSEAWLKWRMTGLSASVASILLDRNPYKTVWRLWAEKTGRAEEDDLSRNPNVIRGFVLEDRARQCCEKILNEDFLLPVCGESDENSLALASFDGLTADSIPAELKCPSEIHYESVVKLQKNSEAFQLYYPQVQQQIYVAGASHGWLMFYSPKDNGEHQLFRIERDDRLIEELLNRIEWFWELVLKDTPPPLDPKRDFFMPDDDQLDEWIFQATDYRAFDQQIKDHEAAIEALKEKRALSLQPMKQMMGSFLKADFAGVNITRYHKRGQVDLERMLKEENVPLSVDDLDKYRKKGSDHIRVTVTNEAMPKNIIDVAVQQRVVTVPREVVQTHYF